jgi:D-xylose transport system ATP-binding protein
VTETKKERGAGGTPLLALRGINKSFGAVQALTSVDLEVYAGEVIGLVGDNGAGKSTLVKTIAGTHQPDSGEFYFEGEQVRIAGPQDAKKMGIATVYQDLAVCDNLDVVSNLFLGGENLAGGLGRPLRWIQESSMEQRSMELLGSLSVTTIQSVRTPVSSLSGGQRQSVAIARSLLGDPKVVILDEPTAALGVAQTREVLDLILRLKERGLGVIVISHNLADVFEVTDHIMVLRLGRRVKDFDVRSSRQEEVVAAITGAELEGADGKDGQDEKSAEQHQAPEDALAREDNG